MFIDFESKKVKNLIRYTGYFVMSVMTLITTVVLIYFAKGYRFDRQTGQVVKDGLMLIDSNPVSATTKINGKAYSSTPGRYNLRAGDYKVNLSREGYRDWQKTVHVAGSAVEWVHYPKMIPANIETVPAFNVTNPEIVSASPDSKMLFVLTKNDYSKLALVYPLSAVNKPLTIAWPSKKVMTNSKSTGVFRVVEWSPDNKHIMLKHVLGAKTEYLSVDTTKPNTTTNLTSSTGINFSQPHFSNNDANKIYALNKDKNGNNNLYLYNLKSPESTPEIFLKNVEKYVLHGNDTVLFATKNSDKSQVGILHKNKKNIIQTLPYSANRSFVLGYGEYSGNDFFVSGASDQSRVYIYKNPIDNSNNKIKPFAVLPIQSPNIIDFSDNNQFVSIQDGNHFAVFNFDAERSYIYDSNLNLNKNQVASWMDDAHLLVNKDNKIYMWDFDNTNLQLLGKSKAGFDTAFSNSYTAMWTIKEPSLNTKYEVMVSSLLANKSPQTFLPSK